MCMSKWAEETTPIACRLRLQDVALMERYAKLDGIKLRTWMRLALEARIVERHMQRNPNHQK